MVKPLKLEAECIYLQWILAYPEHNKSIKNEDLITEDQQVNDLVNVALQERISIEKLSSITYFSEEHLSLSFDDYKLYVDKMFTENVQSPVELFKIMCVSVIFLKLYIQSAFLGTTFDSSYPLLKNTDLTNSFDEEGFKVASKTVNANSLYISSYILQKLTDLINEQLLETGAPSVEVYVTALLWNARACSIYIRSHVNMITSANKKQITGISSYIAYLNLLNLCDIDLYTNLKQYIHQYYQITGTDERMKTTVEKSLLLLDISFKFSLMFMVKIPSKPDYVNHYCLHELAVLMRSFNLSQIYQSYGEKTYADQYNIQLSGQPGVKMKSQIEKISQLVLIRSEEEYDLLNVKTETNETDQNNKTPLALTSTMFLNNNIFDFPEVESNKSILTPSDLTIHDRLYVLNTITNLMVNRVSDDELLNKIIERLAYYCISSDQTILDEKDLCAYKNDNSWHIVFTALYYQSIVRMDIGTYREQAATQLLNLLYSITNNDCVCIETQTGKSYNKSSFFFFVEPVLLHDLVNKTAQSLKKIGNNSCAAEIYEKFQLHENAIAQYIASNRKSDALKLLKRVKDIDDNPTMIYFKACCHNDTEKLKEAWELSDGKLYSAAYSLSQYYYNHITKDPSMVDQAKEWLRKCLQLRYLDPRTHYQLGIICLMQKEYREARSHFSVTANLDKDNYQAHANLAATLLYLGHTKTAAQNILHAVNLAPNNLKIVSSAFNILLFDHQATNALKYFEQLVELEALHYIEISSLSRLAASIDLKNSADVQKATTISIAYLRLLTDRIKEDIKKLDLKKLLDTSNNCATFLSTITDPYFISFFFISNNNQPVELTKFYSYIIQLYCELINRINELSSEQSVEVQNKLKSIVNQLFAKFNIIVVKVNKLPDFESYSELLATSINSQKLLSDVEKSNYIKILMLKN